MKALSSTKSFIRKRVGQYMDQCVLRDMKIYNRGHRPLAWTCLARLMLHWPGTQLIATFSDSKGEGVSDQAYAVLVITWPPCNILYILM